MSFSHIEGVIWDLDGTLYRYDKIFIDACNLAAARTAIDLGLEMDLAEATALAARSYTETGSSFKLLSAHGIAYADFHTPYHNAIDTTILEKNLEMRLALEKIGAPMVILTNASRDWALRTLDHLDLRPVFDDDHILALEDVGLEPKSSSRRGFQAALDIMDRRPDQVLMVEDLAHNLVIAKQMGMTTALVHHGRVPGDRSMIDHLFDDTLELARALGRA